MTNRIHEPSPRARNRNIYRPLFPSAMRLMVEHDGSLPRLPYPPRRAQQVRPRAPIASACPSESAAGATASRRGDSALGPTPRLASPQAQPAMKSRSGATPPPRALAPAPSPPLDAIACNARTHAAHILALLTSGVLPPRSPPKPPNPPNRVAAFTFDASGAHRAGRRQRIVPPPAKPPRSCPSRRNRARLCRRAPEVRVGGGGFPLVVGGVAGCGVDRRAVENRGASRAT